MKQGSRAHLAPAPAWQHHMAHWMHPICATASLVRHGRARPALSKVRQATGRPKYPLNARYNHSTGAALITSDSCYHEYKDHAPPSSSLDVSFSMGFIIV